MSDSEPFLKTPRWLRITCLVAVILVSVAASFYYARNSNILQLDPVKELPTLLFGVSSIALIMVSLIIGVMAFFGWQSVQNTVRERVEANTNTKIASLKEDLEKRIGSLEAALRGRIADLERESRGQITQLQGDLREQIAGLERELRDRLEGTDNELRGRVLTLIGYVLGEMSIEPYTLRPTSPERLEEAVTLCEKGYEQLKRVGGAAEFMALNNLVFYSFVRGDETKRGFLLRSARRLKEVAEERPAPNLLLTACGVIFRYGASVEEREEARSILASFEKLQVPEGQKKEARMYLASFLEH